MKKLIIIFAALISLNAIGQDTQEARDMVAAGLIELGIEGVEVRIMPIPSYLKGLVKGHGDELEGFIRGGGSAYTLYLKDLKNTSLLRVISHELIHLEQINDERLKTLPENIVFWDGQEYNGSSMDYTDKPWENEAHNDGDNLKFKIKKILKNER